MIRDVVCKSAGKIKKIPIAGFTGDPAEDLSKFKRSELESILKCDRKSPVMVVVK